MSEDYRTMQKDRGKKQHRENERSKIGKEF